MLDNRSSDASKPNPDLRPAKRRRNESNSDWVIRQLEQVAHKNRSLLVLLGGADPASVYIRTAQACMRNDHTPSWWCHAVLLRQVADGWSGDTWDLPLALDLASGFPPASNGILEGDFQAYASSSAYPNIALISVPVSEKQLVEPIQRLRRGRSILDAVDLLWHWIGYALGTSGDKNPLYQGMAYPSAAMIQLAYGAAGLDLTPNVSTSAGCPETLWQAARWWYEFLDWDTKTEQCAAGEGIVGRFCVAQALAGHTPVGQGDAVSARMRRG